MTEVLTTTRDTRLVLEAGPEGAPFAYDFRTPKVYDAARLREACRDQGARFISVVEIGAVLRLAIRETYHAAGDPEGGERMVSMLDQLEALRDLPGELAEENEADLKRLEETRTALEAVMRDQYEPLDELIFAWRKFHDVYPVEAVRLFLAAADSELGEIADEGLTNEQLGVLRARGHLAALSTRALVILEPPGQAAKN
jgi:hypothetical protein